MGKKGKLKQIRKLAAQMPEIKIGHVVGQRITGAELHKGGVETVDGKPVDTDGTYSKREVVQVPLNHNRKMKALYNQHGAAGVHGYMNAVKQHIANQVEKVEDVVIPEGRKLQNAEI